MISFSLSFCYHSRTFCLVLRLMSMLLFFISATPIKFSAKKFISDNVCDSSTHLIILFVLKFRHVGLTRFTAELPRSL